MTNHLCSKHLYPNRFPRRGVALVAAQSSSADGALSALVKGSKYSCGIVIIEGGEISRTETAHGDDATLFQAGSISKPVTALVALELAAAGRLDLDADVNEVLTSWRLPTDRPVTVRHLLGHTAGLGVPFLPGYTQDEPLPTLQQALDGAAPATTAALRVDPNRHDTFEYSGGGYAVLQQVIADATGAPFEQAARSRVFEPLGMHSSTFAQPLPLQSRMAAARTDWHNYPEAAAAGLWTTTNDLARCVCALLAVAAGRPSPLDRLTGEAMLTPLSRLPKQGEWAVLPLVGVRRPDSFSLGLFLNGTHRFCHTGGAAGFFSAVVGSTGNNTGAVVMAAANAPLRVFKLLRMISAELGWDDFRQQGLLRLQGFPANLKALF
jgi:CubicO group peptidase (beta-lactamase class C family)